MGFRFRRSARLGPLRFHFSGSGLSSISIGGPGASLNIPVARRGGPRTTVGLPGTGLSWSLEHRSDPAPSRADRGTEAEAGGDLPNSRRLRRGQRLELQDNLLALLQERLFATAGGRRLWEEELVSRLLRDEAIGSKRAGLLALIETPEAMRAYLERSRSQSDARRRAQRCVTAFSLATKLAGERGWLS
jgi:hypothetical protein